MDTKTTDTLIFKSYSLFQVQFRQVCSW